MYTFKTKQFNPCCNCSTGPEHINMLSKNWRTQNEAFSVYMHLYIDMPDILKILKDLLTVNDIIKR